MVQEHLGRDLREDRRSRFRGRVLPNSIAGNNHQGPPVSLPLNLQENAGAERCLGVPWPRPFRSKGGSDRSGWLNELSWASRSASTALISCRHPGLGSTIISGVFP